jgi:hypothetical protein
LSYFYKADSKHGDSISKGLGIAVSKIKLDLNLARGRIFMNLFNELTMQPNEPCLSRRAGASMNSPGNFGPARNQPL